MEWVYFTLLAASMQAVRTAGQKHMTATMSVYLATWARYGYGLPVAICYVIVVYHAQETAVLPTLSVSFWLLVSLASVAQLIGTLLLVHLLTLRNFAVGTLFTKSESLIVAILGVTLFNASLNALAWVAILIGVAGLLLVSVQKRGLKLRQIALSRSSLFGLAAGLSFGLTALFIREAAQELNNDPIFTAAIILVLSIAIQAVLSTVIVQWDNPNQWRQLRHFKMPMFIGVTGVLGSIGWYTAFSYQEAAIVRTFGQIEYIFTLGLTYFFFKERITRAEGVSMVLVLTSVILLLNAT